MLNLFKVQKKYQKKKKTGKDKPKGVKINLDFDNLVLDDGISIEEKEKIIKAYETSAKV